MLVDQFLYKARVITEDEIEEVNSWIIDDVEEAGYHISNYFKEIKLTEGEYIAYINKETYPYYVTYLEEIYAWQNNIDLYHEIRQYKDIDDCSFYKLDQIILKNILKYIDKEYIFEEDLICDENEALFYYEEG